MNISSIGQNLPITSVQNGKKLLSESVNQISTSSKNIEISAKKIDMRNISINELNELIKSGVDSLLDSMPIPSGSINIEKLNHDIDGSYRKSFMNQKFDFLSQIENSIKFEKSINKSTDFLEKILTNLNNINGMKFPSKVDIMT